ncbi:MAG: hypothetical protein KC421_01995 [Anaerolineales bacterium]|nr:hypothetical protein [Anaerolineales bacterium]
MANNDNEIAENKVDKSQYAFEEFQLFYESAEKVTDRRLETNRWNYSICTAIASVIGLIVSWSLANQSFLLVAILGAIILSIMAILFCTLWILQIQDFKQLNNAKFNVLNKMAPKVRFSNSLEDERISFTPFVKEWDELKNTKAVQEMYSTKIVALKSSNIEYAIPQAFRLLFVFIIIGALIILVLNWDIATSSSLHIPTPTPIPTIAPTATP